MVTQHRRDATQRIAAILRARGSPLAEAVGKVGDVQELARAVREQIVDELGEEFAAKGLKSNSEPNAYGLELEALTDVCALAWNNVEEPSGGRQHRATTREAPP